MSEIQPHSRPVLKRILLDYGLLDLAASFYHLHDICVDLFFIVFAYILEQLLIVHIRSLNRFSHAVAPMSIRQSI
jgi:hypothetical protein